MTVNKKAKIVYKTSLVLPQTHAIGYVAHQHVTPITIVTLFYR